MATPVTLLQLHRGHNLEEHSWTLADPADNEVDIATTSAPDPTTSPESSG